MLRKLYYPNMSAGTKKNEFDCIVVGGGHAGAEASYAAAGIGAKTCLITISAKRIAAMSCNGSSE